MVVLREAAGLTQEEAAKRAGMSVRGLSNLERGLVSRPRRASLDALADAFGLTDRDRRRLFDQYRPVLPPAPETGGSWRGPRSHLRELVGRDAELTELEDALRLHDLVTVTGPGGCGKTAIALAAAAATGRAVTVLGLASLATAASRSRRRPECKRRPWPARCRSRSAGSRRPWTRSSGSCPAASCWSSTTPST